MDILLIDDESAITDGVQEELESLRDEGIIGEFKVRFATDFYAAREALDDESYDLIIVDLLMPPYGLGDLPNGRKGVMLTGWTFLYNYVLSPGAEYYDRNKKAKCIIFSAYLDRLTKYWESEKFNASQYKGRLFRVDKGNIFDGSGGFDKLRETIANVLGSQR